ncbi:MAG: DUF2892 domain-containing protein [Saprospiraceae bacterium]|nr:DUF2892 domain-containing protein [Bacteroidia bacterium]NNE16621.1 DUF2892 domain-containing protein [Saprospiraceae bacterium]NNL91912.1 DUF2892 domain-containing protein [Saprospiraceae bacterium]
MRQNIGKFDRYFRGLLSLVLFGLVLSKLVFGLMAYISIFAAVILMATSCSGICPLYGFLGFQTKLDSENE